VPKAVDLSTASNMKLKLHDAVEHYTPAGPFWATLADTGAGRFARGEFSALSALGQMEFVTPEELAKEVVLEIIGTNTGRDLIGAVDASCLGPSYRAGLLRTLALQDFATMQTKHEDQSVALARLVPRQMSKLLFEAEMIKTVFGPKIKSFLHFESEPDKHRTPEDISQMMATKLLQEDHPLCMQATTTGHPILLPDGHTILRGPTINAPPSEAVEDYIVAGDTVVRDAFVKAGWIDLRPNNMKQWVSRFHKMYNTRKRLRTHGTAAFAKDTYTSDEIESGEAVAWVYANELGGYRFTEPE